MSRDVKHCNFINCAKQYFHDIKRKDFFYIFEIVFQNLVFFSWNKNLEAVGEISSVGDKNNSLTEKKLLLTKNQITKIKY